MKKMLVLLIVTVMMCSVTGCNEDQERIDDAAERAIEWQDKAEDAVEDVNEDTLNIENAAEELEAE